MNAVWLNMILAFFEGVGLIVSPCILPILPIILSGSLTGSKARPIGIISGFIVTFTLVTLFSRVLVTITGIDALSLRYLSYELLLLCAVVMFSSYLTEKFNQTTATLLGVGQSWRSANDTQSGFSGGFLFGGLVGLIFTPCAGPLLAAVIVQAIIQATTLKSVLVVAAFAIGVSVPMLLIALLGRKIISNAQFLQRHTALIRQALALLIIGSVVYLIASENSVLTKVDTTRKLKITDHILQGVDKPYPAPEIEGINAWINASPQTLTALKGKVVLIDFWTYSCINCIRTLPYLKSWYDQYHDKGLVIIGVHSPEFAFEHELQNVSKAVRQFGIKYPVALDNDFATWNQFNNLYWPAHYLIDQAGNVVYVHFGEGDYDTTEMNIRFLLHIQDAATQTVHAEPMPSYGYTPEIYLGYARSQNFATPHMTAKDAMANYVYPEEISLNQWALQGSWQIKADYIESDSADSRIKLHFYAGKVYAVLGVKGAAQTVEIINGKKVTQIVVDSQRLYTLLELETPDEGVVELRAQGAGLVMYTFTFGG